MKSYSPMPVFSSPRAAAIAERPHPVNFQETEYDIARLREAATHDLGTRSLSEAVRVALSWYLDTHPDAESISRIAVLSIELEAKKEEIREGIA